MKRRTIAALLTLAALAAAGAGTVRGADELGATVQSRLYVTESRTLHVYNRSTIPATFTPSPAMGWRWEPASLTLDPDTEGTFTLTGDGEDATGTVVRVTPAEAVAAMDASILEFPATIHLSRPFDPGPYLLAAFVGVAMLTATGVVFWLRRRDLGGRHAYRPS